MRPPPFPNCPKCAAPSALILNPEQAFCENPECNVVMFNPSLPDGGSSNPTEIDFPIFPESE
jgi:hypothetical protein